ncbi:MAG: hypothetical protein GKS00_24680 [Alphaproteobacteria bacterium]|nr:hypothetical protein [Alphaproteobacteria bacterium]
MTQQKNLFYDCPDLTSVSSSVIDVRIHELGVAIAAEQNIVRAAGGGEPRDVGCIKIEGSHNSRILDVEKKDGLTWIITDEDISKLETINQIGVEVDAMHRDRRRRLHTAVHMAIRCAYNHFKTFHVLEAEINDDAYAARVIGRANRVVSSDDIIDIKQAMRSQVRICRPVLASKVRSIQYAEETYGDLFRMSARYALKGKVRLVCIEGFDANPCSGLHYTSSNIGPYEMTVNSTKLTIGMVSICLNL